jgi:hypothetical protein
MNTVYKYTLDPPEEPWYLVEVELPMGAQLLSVAFQGLDLCLWAAVDTDSPTERRRFRLAGTGHDLAPHWPILSFIGTAYHPDGYVFHVFEIHGEQP